MPNDTLPTIDPSDLSRVSGGTTSDDQITAILSQITTSLGNRSRRAGRGTARGDRVRHTPALPVFPHGAG